MTVVDGLTLTTTTVKVGLEPSALGIDFKSNKIYVANNLSIL